jgi:FkbM family methyltransferase
MTTWTPMRTFERAGKRALWTLFYANPIAGRLVELWGNRGHLRGLTFDLDNPHIETALKGRFLFGTYESSSVRLVDEYLPADAPVVELGGCIGVTGCLVNRKLRNPAQHVVVEAHHGLVPALRKNRDLNGCRFEIVEGAIAYGRDAVSFWYHPTVFVGGSTIPLEGGREVRVPAVTLGALVRDRGFDRISLISDIQGAEVELVDHEMDVLTRHVDTMVMEIHPADWGAGKVRTAEMLRTLEANGFRTVTRARNDVVFKNRRFAV